MRDQLRGLLENSVQTFAFFVRAFVHGTGNFTPSATVSSHKDHDEFLKEIAVKKSQDAVTLYSERAQFFSSRVPSAKTSSLPSWDRSLSPHVPLLKIQVL
jgi:hypothetical protein